MAAPVTFRFTRAEEDTQFDAIPALQSIDVTPTVVDLGRSMGTRATATATFRDFLYPLGDSDVNSGTFWGKLRARCKSLQGGMLRVLRGEDGEALADMETEHYVIESMQRTADSATIVAKDILKLADDDRAQAPAISKGRLSLGIDDDDTEFTLTPTGIGDLEYPASGKLAIGGTEIVAFTRSGDVCTITRAQSGTVATAHDADEVAQLVLSYTSESPADIVHDLLTTYTDIDDSWCDLDAWKSDIDSYVGRLYTAEIAVPTGIRTLVNELIEQVGLVMYWDAAAQSVQLKSLRPVSTAARSVNTDELLAGSFSFAEQPDKRISEVWTYYGLRNPLAPLDEERNYRNVVATIAEPDADLPDLPAAIKKVYSRWITSANRTAAERLNDMLLARYKDAPRKLTFGLYLTSEQPQLAQGLQLEHWAMQDADGAPSAVACQITSIRRDYDRYMCEAEEMLFTDDGGARVVAIDVDSYEINLRTLYDQIYSPPTSEDEIVFLIDAGVFVGTTFWQIASTATTTKRALTVGDWPEGPTLTLINNGTISGGGGAGSDARFSGTGGCGSHGLYTRVAITVENNGTIAGGGGGGGRGSSGGGGGGAGRTRIGANIGSGYAQGGPNSDWTPGNTTSLAGNGQATTGGAGAATGGGDGGDLGEAGANGTVSNGGAAGNAVDGDSFVTFDTEGTILGSRIN